MPQEICKFEVFDLLDNLTNISATLEKESNSCSEKKRRRIEFENEEKDTVYILKSANKTWPVIFPTENHSEAYTNVSLKVFESTDDSKVS